MSGQRLPVAYTIYHDETNNIRRLYVRSDGLNVREPKCFVLGGIAHRGSPHAFALSHDETGIQIADVVTGLLGKFFSFICETGAAELAVIRSSLSAQQKRTLKALSVLLDRSIAENKAFAHYVLSLEDQEKAGFFLDAPL